MDLSPRDLRAFDKPEAEKELTGERQEPIYYFHNTSIGGGLSPARILHLFLWIVRASFESRLMQDG